MVKQCVFISFDYDHDLDIKTMLAEQAKLPDSSFDFTDASVKDHISGDWKEKVKQRIQNCDQVCVLCGEYTYTATGVNAEVKIAQELGKRYFLLSGRVGKSIKPIAAKPSDKLYKWNWDNLKKLVGGAQ
ncbi:hypothetical protein GALL_280460 [mine drainage metagenome]|uniref:Thoeris protein ThsB TIR-like domain-containing protein n=1 Tax=mine drainage metagenome TaxID=410659 RepID=A0A1J5RDF3_9ZZZZ